MRFYCILAILTLTALPALLPAQDSYPPSAWKSAGTERATNAEIRQWVAMLGPNAEHRMSGCIPPLPWGTGTPADEAAAHLVRVGLPAVEAVLPLLQEKDEKRRRIAAEILGRIGSQHGTAALVRAYPQETDIAARESIVESLVMLADIHAENTLIAALADSLSFTQAEAARGLGRLKSARAIEPLMDLLRKQTPPRFAGFGPTVNLADAAASALAQIGPTAFPPLLELLNAPDTSNYVLTAAIPAANRIGDKRMVPALLPLLESDDEPVCTAAARALGKWKDPQSVAPLRKVLFHSTGNARFAAVNSLAGIGGKEALDAIFAAIADSDADIRQAGISGMLYLQDRSAIPQLIEVLQNGPSEARQIAAVPLSVLTDARALHPLIAATTSPDVSLRMNAVSALRNYDAPEAVTALLAALNDPVIGVVNQAIEALQNRTDRRVLPALRKLAEVPDARIRETLEHALQVQAELRR